LGTVVELADMPPSTYGRHTARATAGIPSCVAEVVQEPIEQPYGVRDCAVRDPAGNLIRIQQLR
jgi:hypothetical protein